MLHHHFIHTADGDICFGSFSQPFFNFVETDKELHMSLSGLYLHAGRSCRSAGVHSLDVTGFAASHHKAPANSIADNLGNTKKTWWLRYENLAVFSCDQQHYILFRQSAHKQFHTLWQPWFLEAQIWHGGRMWWCECICLCWCQLATRGYWNGSGLSQKDINKRDRFHKVSQICPMVCAEVTSEKNN